jgi:phosphomannomutase
MPRISAASMEGTTDDEITPEYALNVGKTLGMQYKNVTLGMDLRPSSPMIRGAMVAGLTATGASVNDAGVLPSPVLPFASEGEGCCVMISSPDSINHVSGICLKNTDGTFFTDSQMFAFVNRLDGSKLLPNYKLVGNVKNITGSIGKYRRKVVSIVGKADCQVVLDCASDCPSLIAPQILTDIGADALTFNCHIDGRSPGREPAPEEINLRILSKIVKSNFGSIGIATNGDGSRIAAIDEDGRYVDGGTILQLLVKFLQPKTLAIPVDTSMAVKDVLKGTAIMTKVGSSHIGESVKTNGLEMGGCNDGSFVFPQISFALDGITAAAFLSRIATETSLRDEIDALPKYFRMNESVRYQGDREGLAKRIALKVGDMGYNKIYEIDGWRIETDDGWFLIRFSESDQVIDIVAEGRDKIYTAGLLEVAKEAVTMSLKAVNI